MKRKIMLFDIKQLILIVCVIITGLLFHGCNPDESDSEPEEYATSISQPELTVYEAPSEVSKSLNYSVFVQYDGGQWIDLHEYSAPVMTHGYGSAYGFSRRTADNETGI